ncbi:MAG: GGDEF domain-containing protein [Lachnospiraceae bacterium]|nr:GGDEF domain-containing protein [Lachnospiraceae bacterium]
MEQFQKYSLVVTKNMAVLSAGESFLNYIGKSKLFNLDQVVPPQDMIQLKNAVFAIDPGASALTCFRIRTSTGKLNWIAANVKKEDNYEETIKMELSDIQTLKEDDDTVRLDPMTGLLNKKAITDYAIHLTALPNPVGFYFCLMDIDHFKNVNDTFGHMKGDEVIADVAHIIRDCVGSNGTVGRIGGDEFMLVLEHVQDKPKAREVMASVRETVEEKYKTMPEGMNITVSIGSAYYPDFADGYDTLFKLTDKMLYLAKQKGRNRYIIYTPEIHGNLNDEVKVAAATRQAVSESAKLKLVLQLMSRFLHKTDIPIRVAIEDVLVAYDLDELFIYYMDLSKCRYGIRRVDLDADNFRIEDKQENMTFLDSPLFQELFDENHVAVLNLFDLNKEKHKELIEYMEQHGRRFMVVYHMVECRKPGYVVFTNERENSRRLSESDILDLIYIARMIEITSSDR